MLKGKWIKKTDGSGEYYACSDCGEEAGWDMYGETQRFSDYCPNCGRYMSDELKTRNIVLPWLTACVDLEIAAEGYADMLRNGMCEEGSDGVCQFACDLETVSAELRRTFDEVISEKWKAAERLLK